MTAFITHPDCWLHSMGAQHPESPDRLSAIRDQLIASGLEVLLPSFEAPLATVDQLCLAHSAEYVTEVFDTAPERGIVHLDSDTAMCSHTLKAALRAAGAGILAVDLVLDGREQSAFCAVRPPGHHATRSRAMGFCFFNNIAIAARYALETHGLERVAIIDFDVHHGNGTEDIFRQDARVLMVGLFQHPLYPYCGIQAAPSHIRNTPLPAGSTGERMQMLWQDSWLPALLAHQPQMIFVSAGFDAHREDDMASLAFVEADYAWVSTRLREFVDENCAGRVVSMLEGGYALSALGRSVAAHLKALASL